MVGEGGPHRRQEWYESQRDSKPQKRPNLIQYESTSKLMSQPMNTPNLKPTRAPKSLAAALLAVVLAASPATHAAPQHTTAIQPDDTAPHRTRLILKDGSYQIVMSYRIVGNLVRYISAERGGAEEEIPVALVDFDATQRWEKQHATPEGEGDTGGSQAPAIDPELLKEEADRAAYTPEVAKDLHLPEQDSVLVLDTFRGTPELVPMPQSDGSLNRNTGHNVLRAAINPLSSSHQIVQLKGEKSPIQLHVDTPVLYVRI